MISGRYDTLSYNLLSNCYKAGCQSDTNKVDIIWTTLWNAFIQQNICAFWYFHRSLFSRVQLGPHWFTQWICTEEATSHYLNQWQPSSLMHIGSTWSQYVESITFNSRATRPTHQDLMMKCCFYQWTTHIHELWNQDMMWCFDIAFIRWHLSVPSNINAISWMFCQISKLTNRKQDDINNTLHFNIQYLMPVQKTNTLSKRKSL